VRRALLLGCLLVRSSLALLAFSQQSQRRGQAVSTGSPIAKKSKTKQTPTQIAVEKERFLGENPGAERGEATPVVSQFCE